MEIKVSHLVWTEKKTVDLWQQHWQVDKKLQNQRKPPSSTPSRNNGSDLCLFLNHLVKSKGQEWQQGYTHIQETLRPIHLQEVAWQGERVWETRIKFLDRSTIGMPHNWKRRVAITGSKDHSVERSNRRGFSTQR